MVEDTSVFQGVVEVEMYGSGFRYMDNTLYKFEGGCYKMVCTQLIKRRNAYYVAQLITALWENGEL